MEGQDDQRFTYLYNTGSLPTCGDTRLTIVWGFKKKKNRLWQSDWTSVWARAKSNPQGLKEIVKV